MRHNFSQLLIARIKLFNLDWMYKNWLNVHKNAIPNFCDIAKSTILVNQWIWWNELTYFELPIERLNWFWLVFFCGLGFYECINLQQWWFVLDPFILIWHWTLLSRHINITLNSEMTNKMDECGTKPKIFDRNRTGTKFCSLPTQ